MGQKGSTVICRGGAGEILATSLVCTHSLCKWVSAGC